MSGGRDIEGGGDSFDSGLDGLDKVSSLDNIDRGIEDNTGIEQNVDSFFDEINDIGETNKDSELNASIDHSEEDNIDEFIDGDIDEISNTIENDRSVEINKFDDIDSNIEDFLDGNDEYNENVKFNTGFNDALQNNLDNFIDGNNIEGSEVDDNNYDISQEQGDSQEIIDKFIDGDIDNITTTEKEQSENDESLYDNIEDFIDGDIEKLEGEENKEIEGRGVDEDSYVEVDSDVDSAEADDIEESDIDEGSEIEVDNDADSAEAKDNYQLESEYNKSLQDMTKYMSEHNYGKEDYAEYSKDPEWQDLNEKMQDARSAMEGEDPYKNDTAEKDKYQLESEYNKSLQDMTKYMSEHNYGKEDYAEYSKDPEWQDLNEKMQDARSAMEGANTENNIQEIDIKYENTNPEYIEDNNKYFGKMEIDENLNKIFIKGSNYEEFKEAYNLGGGYEYRPYEKNKEENINADKIEGITVEKSDIDNPDIFWSQHEKNGTLESFKDIVKNIPNVADQLGKGRTINELLQDEKLSSCTRIYFLDKVKVVKNGDFYEFDGDGRHRVLAAREAGYDIPVEIIGEKVKVDSQNFGKQNNSYYEEKKGDNDCVNEEKKDSLEEQEKEITYNDSDISKSGGEDYSFVDSAEDIDVMANNKKSHIKEKVYKDDNGLEYRVNDNLLPNNEYEVRGYRYKTDDFGRIIEAGGKLRLKEGSGRKNIVDTMDVIGKGDQKEGDQRGHIIGDRFDASNGLENMIAQDAKINMGDYKKLENELARCIMDNKDVYVHIDIVYPERNGVKEGYRRPEALVVTYNIDGKENVRIFPNMKK